MPRNLQVDKINRFKGINQRTNLPEVAPDEALDCRNVIMSSAGHLEKLRYPSTLASGPVKDGQPLFSTGPDSIFYYSKSSPATRQYIGNYANSLYYFDATLLAPVLIETAAIDAPTWNWEESNNVLLGCNGLRAAKWIGTALQKWGIAKPVTPPTTTVTRNITAISRTANVIDVVFDGATSQRLNATDTIRISGVADASFNGMFLIATVVGNNEVTYANNGPNAASAGGAITWFSQSGSIGITVGGAARVNGVVTMTLIASNIFAVGQQVNAAGVTDASFNGGPFLVTAIGANTVGWAQQGADATSGNGTVSTNWSPIGGANYRYAYANAIAGHVGPASDAGSFLSGNFPRITSVTAAAPGDPQVDTIYWYRTFAGGSDYFFLATTPVGQLTFVDGLAETQLDTSRVASLINNPPPSDAKYVAKYQGRMFLAGMVSAPQDIAYSGYERIFVGRPEESFPPNNRLRLAIGADDIRGIGVIQAGVIAFSKSDKMYMLRGIVEDITNSAPVQFTAYLEELPWKIGAFSHYSIAATQYGLVWFASDKTVKLFNGFASPIDISPNVWPILRNVTPGQESNARGSYIAWLDREWYALALAVSNLPSFSSTASYGVNYNNLLLLFDMTPDAEQNVGIFIFDVGRVDSVAVVEDANGQRILVIGQNGNLMQIRTASIAVNGLSQGITGTANKLNAYWRSGYFGHGQGEIEKLWRYGKLHTDQPTFSGGIAFTLQARIVDGEERTYVNPELLAIGQVTNDRFAVNRSGKRCSIEINFPPDDVDINVLELQLTNIPKAIR